MEEIEGGHEDGEGALLRLGLRGRARSRGKVMALASAPRSCAEGENKVAEWSV